MQHGHEDDKRGVCLVSGGMDSCVMLELAKRYGWEMVGLFVQYGQRPEVAEEIAARRVCDSYSILLHISRVSLSSFDSSPLGERGERPPVRTLEEIREHEEQQSEFYVPGRNMILLALAASLAETLGYPAVFIGATLEDYAGFPDCRPEFFALAEQALGVKVKAPLIEMPKDQVARIGRELGAPIDLTSSCYFGRDCGRCPACLLRSEALEYAEKHRA